MLWLRKRILHGNKFLSALGKRELSFWIGGVERTDENKFLSADAQHRIEVKIEVVFFDINRQPDAKIVGAIIIFLFILFIPHVVQCVFVECIHGLRTVQVLIIVCNINALPKHLGIKRKKPVKAIYICRGFVKTILRRKKQPDTSH